MNYVNKLPGEGACWQQMLAITPAVGTWVPESLRVLQLSVVS